MTLLAIPSTQAPLVALQAWVRFGAADESEEIAGLAHLFEHLLFKGTQKRPVGAIAAEIEGLGGDVNAYTSYDQTVMHMTLPKEHMAQGIDILSDALINSVVDAEELKREKEVVLEEIKRRNDMPAAKAYDKFHQLLFKGHPYERPVIGYAKVVENLGRDRIVELYHRYYNTANVFLVVSGDFDTNELLKICEKYFADFRKGAANGPRKQATPLKSATAAYMHDPSPNSIFSFGWQGPDGAHEDVAALDALAFVLGQGDSSRLLHKLVHSNTLLRQVGASLWSPKDGGVFSISCRGGLGTSKKFQKIFETIAESIEKPVNNLELEKAKKNLLSDAIYSMETVDGMAARFGYCELLGDTDLDSQYLDQVRALTIEDLERVKKQYLDWSRVASSGIFPKSDKLPDLEAAIKKWQATKSKKESVRNKGTKAELKVQVFEHKGLKVILRRRQNLPIFSLRWMGWGGMRAESDPKKAGLASLWARAVLNGGVAPDGQIWGLDDLNEELDRLGADLNAAAGKNSFYYSLDGLSEDFEKLFKHLLAILRKPTFEAKLMENDKSHMLTDIKSAEDNPSYQVGRLLAEGLFGKHHYSQPSLGTAKTLKSIKSKDLEAFHQKLLRQPQVLSIVGDVSADQVKALLNKYLANAMFRKASSLSRKIKPRSPTHFVESRKILKKEQSHIMLAWPTVDMTHPDRWPLTALAAVLSGQGGRLFVELRDKMSLCYTVAPTHLEAVDAGYFAFYIACSPDKEKDAVEALRKEIFRVAQEGVPEEEWKRALNYYQGNYLIEEQKLSSQALGMGLDELYGLGYKEYLNFSRSLGKVKARDLQRVARVYFDSSAKKGHVLAVVGPK